MPSNEGVLLQEPTGAVGPIGFTLDVLEPGSTLEKDEAQMYAAAAVIQCSSTIGTFNKAS